MIGLCFGQSDDGYLYPYADRLKKLLEQKDFVVWSDVDAKVDIRSLLKMLAVSEPALLMPEFATGPVSPCMQHGLNENNIDILDSNCDKPEDLVESIESIFVHLEEQ